MGEEKPEFITIGPGCTFIPNTFGPIPYTGAVVLSPGPGLPLGLSAASACSCCRADQKAYLLFKDGIITDTGIISGRDPVSLPNKQITLQKTEFTYYKVSYLPGATDVGGCCKCLANQYELTIPLDSKATTWCDLHNLMRPRGVTAKALTALTKEVLTLRLENKGYRKRLGIAEASPTPTTPEPGELSPIDKIIADVLSGSSDCGC